MTFDPHAYTITVKKVVQDGEPCFKATVAELPNLATYEDSHEAAYAAVIDDIEALYAMALEHDHAFPEPIQEMSPDHSGRVTLRIPRSLHCRLAEHSASEDVSLNTCIITLLSDALTAKNIGAAVSASIEAQVRAAITATQVVQEAGGKATAGYATTVEVSMTGKGETWTNLH